LQELPASEATKGLDIKSLKEKAAKVVLPTFVCPFKEKVTWPSLEIGVRFPFPFGSACDPKYSRQDTSLACTVGDNIAKLIGIANTRADRAALLAMWFSNLTLPPLRIKNLPSKY
jgi:hypothetical protein